MAILPHSSALLLNTILLYYNTFNSVAQSDHTIYTSASFDPLKQTRQSGTSLNHINRSIQDRPASGEIHRVRNLPNASGNHDRHLDVSQNLDMNTLYNALTSLDRKLTRLWENAARPKLPIMASSSIKPVENSSYGVILLGTNGTSIGILDKTFYIRHNTSHRVLQQERGIPCLAINLSHEKSWYRRCKEEASNSQGASHTEAIVDPSITQQAENTQRIQRRDLGEKTVVQSENVGPKSDDFNVQPSDQIFYETLNHFNHLKDLLSGNRDQSSHRPIKSQIYYSEIFPKVQRRGYSSEASPDSATDLENDVILAGVGSSGTGTDSGELRLTSSNEESDYYEDLRHLPDYVNKRDNDHQSRIYKLIKAGPRHGQKIPLPDLPRTVMSSMSGKSIKETEKCKPENDGTVAMKCSSDGETCLYDAMICDGKKDCPQGEDETFALCVLRHWTFRLVRKMTAPKTR